MINPAIDDTLLRRIAPSRWLRAAIVLHAIIVAWFIFTWGPDFRHAHPSWNG